MVSVEVFDQNDDVKAKRDDDGVDLGGTVGIGLRARLVSRRIRFTGQSNLSASGQEINHLLNGTGSMHIQRDVDQIRGNGITDEVTLFIRRVLQQLLAKVVAKGVGHQVSKVSKGLAEDDISVIRDPFLQLLLEVTAAVLILAQACNFTNKVLESGTSEAIN